MVDLVGDGKGGGAYVGVAAEGLCDGGHDHVGDGGDVDVAEGADGVVDDHGDVVLVGLGGLVQIPQEKGLKQKRKTNSPPPSASSNPRSPR